MQTIMLQTTVLLFASIVSLHIVCLHGLPRLNYVQTFDEVTDIEEFTTLPGVNVVYYYQKGIKRLHPFLKAYNDSASHLQAYNIHLAMVDCTKKGVLLLDKCQEEHNRKEISIYKNGKLLLAVPRTNMFDVESIMSNALQVMLLKEVPLVQTQEELIALEQKMKGKHHLIFSYQHAIGTAEHRVLMEVAYTYQELCKFGLTTLQSTVAALPGYHESDTTAIWLFKCLDNTDDTKSCAVEKYGGNFDLISVMEFVQTLDVDLVQDAGDSGDADPYIDVGLHVVILLYDDSSHSDVKVIGEQIVHRFYGILGVVLVHKNHKLAVSSLEKFAEIKKIPQLIIILRGENGIFYDGILSTDDQTLTKIYRFVHIVLKPVMEKEEIERTGHYMSDGVPELLNYASSPDEQESLLWSVEEQDDPVALHVMELKLKKKIHLDKVLALTDKTFPVETQQEFTVVVFYVTFDDRSMAFLYSYIQAALSLAEQNITSLRRVDCFDWTDVCSKHNITRYPTVQFFRKGHAPWQYNTTLDMNTLVNTVKLFLSGSPIHLQSTSEVREFSEGKIPSDSVSSISVLGIINNEQTQELSLLKSLAEKYVGRYMFGYADEDSAHEIISSMSVTAPGVVVYKHTDIYEPHTIHSGAFTEDDLTQFVQNAAHSTFPELTIYNFPALHKQQKPILLLFLIDEEIKTSETYNLIGQIALAADKSINFAWLNASDTKSIGYRVMNTYYDGIREGSALTVLNHRKGIIYNFDVTSGFTHDDITLWLQNIQDENVLPTKSLNNDEWKPVNPGYDFLAMMDNEEYRQKNPKRCLNNSCRTKPPESQVRTESLEAEDKHEQQYTHTEL